MAGLEVYDGSRWINVGGGSTSTLQLVGDGEAEGELGTPITFTLTKPLNEIINKGDVNFKGFRLMQVKSPEDIKDGINFEYLFNVLSENTDMALFVNSIDPNLSILGPQQAFVFGEVDASLTLKNTTAPTPIQPIATTFGLENSEQKGFEFVQNTTTDGTAIIDTLSFERKVGATKTPIFSVNDTTIDVSGKLLVGTPATDNEAANKGYVDASITSSLSSLTLSPSQLTGFPNDGFKVLKGDGSWGFPTETDQKFKFNENNKEIYIRASSPHLDMLNRNVRNNKSSSIIETNAYNETASIIMNGDYIQTIQTFDDLGFIFSDEDHDPQTAYRSYISSSGSLVVTPSLKTNLHSIREKEPQGYLDRLNQLKVYSFGEQVPIQKTDSDKTKTRKYFKNKTMQVGFLGEEVADLFDNATDKTKLLDLKKEKSFLKSTQGFTPQIKEKDYVTAKNQNRQGEGINYNTLLCYVVLALQELNQKVNAQQ